MNTPITSNHWSNTEGVPTGGCTFGPGFTISWQNGALGRDGDRVAPNGAFVENVIMAAKDRIEYYQRSRFACQENAEALEHLNKALAVLDARTKAREARKVEGTHNV